tara:strand:+ start:758 stop:940 length:183 start_codon:yes stop_codon:yes gene_type:complete
MKIFRIKNKKLSSRQRRELAFKELALKNECRERMANRSSFTIFQTRLLAESMNATMRSSR